MKAITLHQPYASLIAVGAKTIETRGRATSYRGRIAIHAGKRRPPTYRHHNVNDDLPPALDLIAMSGCWEWTEHPDDCSHGGAYRWRGPLGAVVASAVVEDCVPIGGEHLFRSANWQGYEQEHQDETVCVVTDGSLGRPRVVLDRPGAGLLDVSDQEPFGDFTPGRWAILLGDVARVEDRCPWCWGEGRVSRTIPGVPPEVCTPSSPCPVCWPRDEQGALAAWDHDHRRGKCDPIPARGQQAVPWEWDPTQTSWIRSHPGATDSGAVGAWWTTAASSSTSCARR